MSPYHTYLDQQLVELLKNSDNKAFTEIYSRYSEALYRYAWNILESEAECKDVVQEVFVWFWENRKKLKVTSLKYYLLAAVKYKLIRIIQKNKRRNELLAARQHTLSTNEVEETVELQELKAVIADFTQSLPARAKKIFQLSREKYISNKEIAERMQISEKTVENQMTINLRKLRHALDHLSSWFILL